jgi:peptidoglycan-N-acetylglucosamine deacetylase
MINSRSLKFFIPVFLIAIINELTAQDFTWPKNKQMALSLSFDDARESQVTIGTPLLDSLDIKVTFYVFPGPLQKQLTGWRAAVKNGHEIANHSLTHPCSENFAWARKNALENMSLKQMEQQLIESNKQIKEILGVEPKHYAYPCGLTYVGRGVKTKSYVPLVAKYFQTGRDWMGEAPNDPMHCNFDQLTCISMDGKSFEELLPIIEEAKKNKQWLILGGHEINTSGNQTSRTDTIKKLAMYAKDPNNGIWLDPVGTIADYIKKIRD